MNKIIFLMGIFFNPLCFGKLTITSIGEIFHEVPLIQSSKTEIDGAETPLIPFSHALVSIPIFKIYVAQLLNSDPDQFKREDILHLYPQQAIAIRMTFLMSLDGDRIYSSMEKALEKNEVDIHREDISAYLEVLRVSVEEGDSFSFVGKKLADGQEIVEVKIPDSRNIFKLSGPGLIRDVFSPWLKNVSYEGYLEDMQRQLFGQIPPASEELWAPSSYTSNNNIQVNR